MKKSKASPTRIVPRAGDYLVWPDGTNRRILRVMSPNNPGGDGKLHILYKNENVEDGKTWMCNAERVMERTGIFVQCMYGKSYGEMITYGNKPSEDHRR